MQWFHSMSIRNKLLTGCYTIVAIFSIALILGLLLTGGSIVLGLVIIVIAAAVTFPLVRVIENALTSSIDEMTSIAFSIAKGDFTKKVDTSSSASLGELGHSFNSMVDKVREILKETSTIARVVNDTSRSIFDKNINLKQVMEQVATSAGELATGANTISEDVSDMADSIRDIETKVTTYAHSTKEMNMRSEQTIALVERGRLAVESQSHGMSRNVEATSQVADAIEELARKADGISAITRTISDLAEQTNLLSLNASIEAARAGEHGRGFAVVAQEVRKLAEESTSSTKEIHTLVRSIDQGVKQAIQNIKVNEEVVQLQMQMLRDSELVFSELVTSVQFITQQITEFSAESDQMMESARKISGTIQNISAITQQSAAGTEQVSASMNEQMGSVQDVVTETEKMQQIVMQLQRTMSIFKI
ncbi:methyl-accepting chemotaxis protein [Paenibacillus sp. OV219]|uniref:methyl-accepting chemotaxis protein n=1 Tax=Paenibacillus sp. OV219 TaxID=1884377 RepID=UPI0008CABC89|nr:HAMP domain-containing methyl-accepting chemotaxis protein [Paenibacillus sp. OV219]SEO17107.1 methyl-accepting chemotaxis protein [Paenibacillus sp. OV219]